MSNTLNKYDSWLTGDDSPAALVIQEHVMPVEGTRWCAVLANVCRR